MQARQDLGWQYLLPLPHAALPEVLTQSTCLQEQQLLLSLPPADTNPLLCDRIGAAQLHESALQMFKWEADAACTSPNERTHCRALAGSSTWLTIVPHKRAAPLQ